MSRFATGGIVSNKLSVKLGESGTELLLPKKEPFCLSLSLMHLELAYNENLKAIINSDKIKSKKAIAIADLILNTAKAYTKLLKDYKS